MKKSTVRAIGVFLLSLPIIFFFNAELFSQVIDFLVDTIFTVLGVAFLIVYVLGCISLITRGKL